MARQIFPLLWSVAVLVVTPAAGAHAGDDTAVPVTDPVILESFGFPAHARNVSVIPHRLNQPLDVVNEPTDYFGGTASGFSSYVGQSFKPTYGDPAAANRIWDTALNSGDIHHVGGSPNFQTQLDLPNGALLQAVRWWARDTDATVDIVFSLQRICLPNTGPGVPAVTVLASQSTLGSAGDMTGEMVVSATVDMKQCTYSMNVRFGQNSPANLLYKVRVQWVRQVSPPPATARFLDVPTNHPFFRFVEALASSGVTGGCTQNQFCPDSPVTRGQMAVFLATALGLNWGGL